MPIPTPVFPASVATDAQLKVANNLVTSTLRVAATLVDNVLFVNSAAGFTPNCLVTIDSEIMAISTITTGATPTLTVASGGRGFDGTTAAPHPAGAKVSMFIDAWHHNALSAEIQAVQQFLGPNGLNFVALPYGDIRHFGAVCDGVTNDYPALLAADAAGARVAFIPRNCLIKTDVLALTSIQHIVGEDWITSVISTASNPAVTAISVPPGMLVENIRWITAGAAAPGNAASVRFYHNGRTVNDSPSMSAWNSYVNSVGEAGDWQGVGLRQYGTGDGLYTESMPGSNGWGIRARNSSTQGAALFENYVATGSAIMTVDVAGTPGATHITMASNVKTGGNWVNVSHNGSAFVGQVFTADMAHGSGSFAGLFLNFANNSVSKLSVDSQGNITAAGFLKTNNAVIHAGAGVPNGSVPGSPGDIWLNTNGGAGTTLWVKESGSGTTSGWVAK